MQIIRLLTILFLCFSSSAFAESRDPYKFFFNESWGDYQEELKNAETQKKKAVMLFFEMDECPFCHYMKTHVLNQPEVQEYFRKHFLLFAVDIEGDIEIKNMQGKQMKEKDFSFKEHRVRATPVIAFFNTEGKQVFRHTGRTSGIEEFMAMGKYVAEGIYEKMSFVRYKRMLRKEKNK